MNCDDDLVLNFSADFNLEETELNISVFLVEETNPSILFLHTILHNTSTNHVHTRGRASGMGDLLRPDFDDDP